MAYSRKLIFNSYKSISEALKVIKPEEYLFQLKPWIHQQIFRQECESTSFVKINLLKMQF